MAEPIKLMFGMVSGVESYIRWRHLANTVERLCSVAMSWSATRVGNALYCQITLGNLVCSCDGMTIVMMS